MRFCAVDFEFSETAEAKLKLVCCSYRLLPENIKHTYWLHNDPEAIKTVSNKLRDIIRFRPIISYGVSAEASSFISANINPTHAKWICLFTEFKCLGNHNNRVSCGKHLVDGKEVNILPPKPKWQKTEEDKSSGKITYSYSQACFKFLGIKIDNERKTKLRELIISNPPEYSLQQKQEIMEYCESDTEHLWPLYLQMIKTYERDLPRSETKNLYKEMTTRGEAMARSAIIERQGYPIDVDATLNFSKSTQIILSNIQRDINSQFPSIRPFEYNPKTGLYTMKSEKLKNWIKKEELDSKWLKTDSGDISLKLEAWKQYFDFRHDFPRGNFGAQIVRFLNTKQNLNGFMPSKDKNKKTFWDYVGRDGIVRPYINPYGSQASRYQPSATSFLFLKSAWMRSLCVPPRGFMMVGIDFKSEEFLIKAITFLDKAMMNAYNTGDPYLAFAKDIKLVPKKATKQTHPVQRQQAKSSILGIQYDMTKYGLARKLTQDTGVPHSEEEAQFWINAFNEAYVDQYLGGKEFINSYREAGYAKLLDGWVMFGDNINDRSVGNFPHQGHGAVVLRRAISYCQEEALKVSVPLHDALYCMIKINDWETVDVFAECMKQAFKDSFPPKYQQYADVLLDIEAWSPYFKHEGTLLTPKRNSVKVEKLHKDERAISEYERFSKYFKTPDYLDL